MNPTALLPPLPAILLALTGALVMGCGLLPTPTNPARTATPSTTRNGTAPSTLSLQEYARWRSEMRAELTAATSADTWKEPVRVLKEQYAKARTIDPPPEAQALHQGQTRFLTAMYQATRDKDPTNRTLPQNSPG